MARDQLEIGNSKGERGSDFLVKDVRLCLSYKQCLLYRWHTLQTGVVRSHFAFRRRHSRHGCPSSDKGRMGGCVCGGIALPLFKSIVETNSVQKGKQGRG